MQRIFIKCPTTGKLINTGFAMDIALLDSSPVELNPIDCPACGQKHTWQKKDALLERESESPQ